MHCSTSAKATVGNSVISGPKVQTVNTYLQEELIAEKYMRAPADASLADKGRAKGKKATKRAGATAVQGFRKYSSPSDIQVGTSSAFASNKLSAHVFITNL